MAAYLGKSRSESRRYRLVSVAISLIGHGIMLYLLLFMVAGAPKKHDLQSVVVSISPTLASKPEPAPTVDLVRPPEIVQPLLPQIDTAAPPSPNAIQAAPLVAAPVPAENMKKDSPDAATSPPRFDAGYLNNPAPVYPNMSRRLREIGVVELRVRVGMNGEPLEIQLFKTSGYPRLDEAARAAVQKWKFEPAKQAGRAVEAWVLVPVEFSLTRG